MTLISLAGHERGVLSCVGWFDNKKTMRSSVKISYQVFSPSTEGNVSEDQDQVTTQTIGASARVTFGKIINHKDTLSPPLLG